LHCPNLLNIHNHELLVSPSSSTRSVYVPARHCPLLKGVTTPAALVGTLTVMTIFQFTFALNISVHFH